MGLEIQMGKMLQILVVWIIEVVVVEVADLMLEEKVEIAILMRQAKGDFVVQTGVEIIL